MTRALTPSEAHAQFDALTPSRPETWRRDYVNAALFIARPFPKAVRS